VRVIGGALRGRSLRAPRGAATRPTADRVREALFGMLGDLSGSRVADLYAGSGALGIEALSRGAARAVFVDSSSAAVATVRHNLERLGIARHARVIQTRVERSRAALLRSGPYDLILSDPPWDELDRALSALARLLRAELLSTGSKVVVEHPARKPLERLPRGDLGLLQRRTWGDTAVSIFHVRPTGRNVDPDPG
jgi:16S rRNA (guanine966-N2)-methyltransferase